MTAEIEGREWVKTERPKKKPTTGGYTGRTSASSSTASIPLSSKEQNEAYFSRLGSANSSRPDHIPPSQGGKYAGFGSTPAPAESSSNTGFGLDEISRDPVAALTKGWGFFTSTALKGVQTVNQQVLQPTAQRLAEADIGKTAAQLGQRVGETGRAGFEGFTRFVEGPAAGGKGKAGPADDKRDFWESFGQPAETPQQQQQQKPSALGTSAMKPAGGGSSGGAAQKSAAQKKDDDWGDW